MNELDSTCGISDERISFLFAEAIRIDNEIKRLKGVPVADYDEIAGKAFLEYPDGEREYVS